MVLLIVTEHADSEDLPNRHDTSLLTALGVKYVIRIEKQIQNYHLAVNTHNQKEPGIHNNKCSLLPSI